MFLCGSLKPSRLDIFSARLRMVKFSLVFSLPCWCDSNLTSHFAINAEPTLKANAFIRMEKRNNGGQKRMRKDLATGRKSEKNADLKTIIAGDPIQGGEDQRFSIRLINMSIETSPFGLSKISCQFRTEVFKSSIKQQKKKKNPQRKWRPHTRFGIILEFISSESWLHLRFDTDFKAHISEV